MKKPSKIKQKPKAFYFCLFACAIAIITTAVLFGPKKFGSYKEFKNIFGTGLPGGFEQIPQGYNTQNDEPWFKFHLNKIQFEKLSLALKASGYSNWKESGGTFGDFNEDSRPDDILLLSYKYDHRWKLMFFYRPSTGILNAVTFFN